MTAMVVLMYHDIVAAHQSDCSGFTDVGATHYKISPDVFEQHLQVLSRVAPSTVISFDDGGASALEPTCTLLERYGFRGMFFVPTSRLGSRGFCSASDLREIVARGHSIGSHSHTHPIPISRLSGLQLSQEWTTSRSVLEDQLGIPISTASVPGGFASPAVVQAAVDAGFQQVFTSVPTQRVRRVGNALVVGRFSITRATSLRVLESVSLGASAVWLRHEVLWYVKRLAKNAAGPLWFALRRHHFERKGQIGRCE